MIAFRVIAYTTIALFAVFVFISISAEFFPTFTGPVMCKMYQASLGIMPIPDFAKPKLPWYCSPVEQMGRVELSDTDAEKLEYELYNLIMSCWKKSENGAGRSDIRCYEVYLNPDGPITEENIALLVRDNGKCEELPDNHLDIENIDIPCGSKNSLYWEAEIKAGSNVVNIDYEYYFHRIVVV